MELITKIKSSLLFLLFLSCFNVTMAQDTTAFVVDGFEVSGSKKIAIEYYFPYVLYDCYYKNFFNCVELNIREIKVLEKDSLDSKIGYIYSKKSGDGFCKVNDSLLLNIPVGHDRMTVSYYVDYVLVKDSIDVARLISLTNDEVKSFHYDKIINSIFISTDKSHVAAVKPFVKQSLYEKRIEEIFPLIFFGSFALIFSLFIYFVRKISHEYKLYRLFSKDNEMRTLLANDPRRFHISLVYLMAYLTRSNAVLFSYPAQKEKLKMVVRYIREAIPNDIQDDAIWELKFLTDKKESKGFHKSVISVQAFNEGRECIIDDPDYDYRSYVSQIHGRGLAEELALYVSDEDRMYIMYMFFRLAMADNDITRVGTNSEKRMLHRLCVEGMKIDERDFDEILNDFSNNNAQSWYERHFGDKEGKYPAHDQFADVFRENPNRATLVNKTIPNDTSDLGFLKFFFLLMPLLFVGFWCLCRLISNYQWMTGYEGIMPHFTSWPALGVMIFSSFFMWFCIKKLDSSQFPILRTKIEDRIQLKNVISSSIFSASLIGILILWTSYILLHIGNETFSNPNLVDTVRLVDYQAYNNDDYNRYCIEFEKTPFSDKSYKDSVKRDVSPLNRFCLEVLPILSGVDLEEAEIDQKTSCEVLNPSSIPEYVDFKVGYYDLVYLDANSFEDY